MQEAEKMDESTRFKDKRLLRVDCNFGSQKDGTADSGIGTMPSPTTEESCPFSNFEDLSIQDNDKSHEGEKDPWTQTDVKIVDKQNIDCDDSTNDHENYQSEASRTFSENDSEMTLLDRIFQQDINGDTLLHLYICKQDSRKVHTILQHCPSLEDINLQNCYQQTALHLATCVESASAVELLLRYGADVELVDEQGNNIWHIAAEKENPYILKVICLLYATENVLPPLVRQSMKAMLTSKNFEGRSPIHTAVNFNRKSAVDLLMLVGADVNDKDYGFGYTPLHYAARMGDATLVTQLIYTRRADVSPQAQNGITPLHLAISYSHAAVVAILLGAGADADALTHEGDSARSFANNCEVFGVLREMGVPSPVTFT